MAHYEDGVEEGSSLDFAAPARLPAISSAVDTTVALSHHRAVAPEPVPDMPLADLITKKLTDAFAPEAVSVADESHLHEGHAGHRPGGETHFRVYIVATAFQGKSRIERHRMVNAALAEELAGRVHALAIKAQAPGEAG